MSYSHQTYWLQRDCTHKPITRMYPLTALPLCNFDNAVSIKVGGNGPQIKRKWGAQRMLSSTIWICVEGGHSDTILRSSLANTSA